MKGSGQKITSRMGRGCRAAIEITVLVGTMVWQCGAQEKPEPAMPGSTEQAAANATTASEKELDRPELQERHPEYLVSRGDSFDLAFPFSPEFNQTVTVQPDGFITLMNLGERYVAGKTVPQLRQLVQGAYAKILRDPVINVVPKDIDKPFFIAGGQIGRPGKYDLRGDTTLAEAIAIAGGFTGSSKHSQVLLVRRVSRDWAKVQIINMKKMLQEGNFKEDVHLQPGDMFFVPQNSISKIKPWIPYVSVTTGFNPTNF
jgi:polysaccharide export outer membrane protein